MRLHQPTGIWLLLWPCWWAIALASSGWPSPALLLLFALGAVLMRGAGCIVNDIADRHIDREVERTRTRPLASGELRVAQAVMLLLVLLAGALSIALTLGPAVVMWALLSLIPVAIYPWMKRISWWPQLFLGLTFNWGALMGYAAVRGAVEWPAIALYVGGIFWTLGYDTIYAHQDKEDDARIGVKSTALRLGDRTPVFVGLCYAAAVSAWIAAGWFAGLPGLFYALMLGVFAHFFWQLRSVDLDNPLSCRRAFVSNCWLGGWVFMAFLAGNIGL
jgi:4-hydroxybenzoate polyprenyltransferase